jgi:transcriptional regulator NrdR family protein
MTEVIKRNGDRELFDPEKLKNSIEKAIIDAGSKLRTKHVLIDRVASKVVIMTMNNGKIRTDDIRRNILTEMNRMDPSVSSAWRNYDRENKVA